MDQAIGSPLPDLIAALEHLTGPSRGSVSWIHTTNTSVIVKSGRLTLSANTTGDGAGGVSQLRRSGSSYEIEASPGQPLWVNGERCANKMLSHGDMIEFGETGPLSRFRLYDATHKMRWTIDQIIGDCIAYVRTSRRPLGSRLLCAARNMFWRLAKETSIIFRATVLIVISALAVFSYQQWRLSGQLQRSIARGTEQLEGVATALARSRAEALRPSDLTALREELGLRVTSNIERLEILERYSRAGARVVADATDSVAFIQGAYGLREIASGRMLRQVVGSDGIPLTTPRGQPLLSLEGDGPVAEIQFTGTGFFLHRGELVTNRHVALPWESNANSEALAARGHEPVLLKLIAYLPDQKEPIRLELVSKSDDADLAILQAETTARVVPGLDLAKQPPKAGEEIILMGYPTGLRSMLARSGVAFVKKLQDSGDLSFWNVASRLAEDGLLSPLASRGIVGKVGEVAIVYDAETTHGGSGGPVLNLKGEVIAVNSAILPEFGGSNLGVPADNVRTLVEAQVR